MVSKLHYDLITAFNHSFYDGLLLESDIVSEIHLKKMTFPDGSDDEEANFWGYLIEKHGKKYLLSEYDTQQNKIEDIKTMFPLKVIQSEKVSSGGVVYHNILQPQVFSIRSEQSMQFRELVDELSSIESTNSKHQKLNWFIQLAQLIDRCNFRVATNPGFGKDSTIDIMGTLIGGCGTIENPTIAKLEERANVLKHLAINEVVGISKAQWKDIELFLLATGAHKPKVTKRSRAFGSIGEEIDISQFSLSLLYNDITDYPDPEEYLDNMTKKAVLDRFPPFRLNGRLTENFDNIREVSPVEYAQKNKDYYLKLIRNFLHFKKNLPNNNYAVNGLIKLQPRWKLNVTKLLKVIDPYCTSQGEFDSWVIEINKSITDYLDMVKYPKAVEMLEKKFGVSGVDKHLLAMHDMVTFTERLKYINDVLQNRVPITDKGLSGWTDEEIL